MPKGDKHPEIRFARKAAKLERRKARTEKRRAAKREGLQRGGWLFSGPIGPIGPIRPRPR